MSPLNEERKLKRGLKDISPLFSREREEKTVLVENAESGIQILNVFSPDLAGDSLFLNTYLASQVASRERPCSILSIHSRYLERERETEERNGSACGRKSNALESLGAHLKRHTLSWDELEQVWQRPLAPRLSAQPRAQILFLDFEYSQAPYFERVIPLLDTWILYLEPSLESLSEAYKMIKAASTLNVHLEYFLLFAGKPADKKGDYLYERFSDMAARRLGVSLNWLGSLHLPRGSQAILAELALDRLMMKSFDFSDSCEKISLAELTHSFMKDGLEKVS